jgi:uncharacterized tellurite resistance protein B-like protein
MTTRQQALLYLTHLLVYSDGEYDDDEKMAIRAICKQEEISDEDYQDFGLQSLEMSEREIFDGGVDLLESCSDEDKMAVCVWLYKLSEADGLVHAKEVRFLLYSLKRVHVDFEEVKKSASQVSSIF